MKIFSRTLSLVLVVVIVGLLSSCMEMSMRSENWKSLDMYGRVIDQYGQPVGGAHVRAGVGYNVSMVESGGKFIDTETDAQGAFHFLHVRGAGMGVNLEKEGYYFNQRAPSQPPRAGRLDPKDPAVFTLWKIRGSEPLLHSGIDFNPALDGTTQMFDLTTGKSVPDGDFKFTFVRVPAEIPPGLVHPYDWNFKIEMPKGGLLPENDAYPYWAPKAGGYQPVFNFVMTSKTVPWESQFEQSFYIKDSSGNYGVMKVMVHSASQPPRVLISFAINASGSQNVEPDFSKMR